MDKRRKDARPVPAVDRWTLSSAAHNLDPEQLRLDLEWVRDFSRPVLLTLGDQSPPPFEPVVGKLAQGLPHVEVLTFPEAGHVPHVTHPDAYVEAIIAFTRKHAA